MTDKMQKLAERMGWDNDTPFIWFDGGTNTAYIEENGTGHLTPAGAVAVWDESPGIWVTVMAQCTRGGDFCTAVRDAAFAWMEAQDD